MSTVENVQSKAARRVYTVLQRLADEFRDHALNQNESMTDATRITVDAFRFAKLFSSIAGFGSDPQIRSALEANGLLYVIENHLRTLGMTVTPRLMVVSMDRPDPNTVLPARKSETRDDTTAIGASVSA